MWALLNYFSIILVVGDWMNDHLTELSPGMVDMVKVIGHALAMYLGN
jgi:hypothetical protein